MSYVPLDVYRLIFYKTKFKTQIKFRIICKKFYDKCDIVEFYNIHIHYRTHLTDDILKQHKNIKFLDAWPSYITDEGIADLKLHTLIAHKEMTDDAIKNMSLHTLYTSKYMTIEGIKHMNLFELYALSNGKINEDLCIKYPISSHIRGLGDIYCMRDYACRTKELHILQNEMTK